MADQLIIDDDWVPQPQDNLRTTLFRLSIVDQLLTSAPDKILASATPDRFFDLHVHLLTDIHSSVTTHVTVDTVCSVILAYSSRPAPAAAPRHLSLSSPGEQDIDFHDPCGLLSLLLTFVRRPTKPCSLANFYRILHRLVFKLTDDSQSSGQLGYCHYPDAPTAEDSARPLAKRSKTMLSWRRCWLLAVKDAIERSHDIFRASLACWDDTVDLFSRLALSFPDGPCPGDGLIFMVLVVFFFSFQTLFAHSTLFFTYLKNGYPNGLYI